VSRPAETVTQFCARALGLLPCPPPTPRRGPAHGLDARCWLCGGATDGVGWPQSLAIAPTFTQFNCARASDSDAVCQSCVALTRAETFQAMVAARKLPLKTWTQCGWHSYSHLIREDGAYAAPDRETARAVVIDPPPGRWVMGLNTSGKKHTLFRGAVAGGAGVHPIQLDETTVWVDRDDARACLGAFEALSALGFAKDDTLAGRYHPAGLSRAGLARWRPAETAIAPWRERAPDLMALIHHVARGPSHFGPPPERARDAPPPAETPKPPPRAGAQMELF
jgi:hypothetical protein